MTFFTRVLDEIIEDKRSADVMYKKQEDFYKEDVHYKEIGSEDICLNQIKKHLHCILTRAVFEYKPCCELLVHCQKKTDRKEWSSSKIKWLYVNTVPYHQVSQFILDTLLLFLF